MAPPECVGRQLLRVGKFIPALSCPADAEALSFLPSVLSSSPDCSLQLPHSQLLEQVEVVSPRAGEQKKQEENLYFGILEAGIQGEKLKNVT